MRKANCALSPTFRVSFMLRRLSAAQPLAARPPRGLGRERCDHPASQGVAARGWRRSCAGRLRPWTMLALLLGVVRPSLEGQDPEEDQRHKRDEREYRDPARDT